MMRRAASDYDWIVVWSDALECMVVLPVDDFAEHRTDDVRCWCDPQLEDDVLVHYACDGRAQFRRHAS